MKIVWIGDSITYGERATPGVVGHTQTFAFLVSAMRGAEMINKGVPSNTSSQMLARFDADVTPNNPDWVVLMCGTNDAYPDTLIPLATFEANVRSMIAKSSPAQVVLMTPPVTTYAPEIPAVLEYVNKVRDIAADTGTVLVDVHQALSDCKVYEPATFAGLLMDDWHPTVTGHAFIANLYTLARYQAALLNPGLSPDGENMRSFALVTQSGGSYALQSGAVNASSVTKLATGRVKVSFATPLESTNYAMRASLEEAGNYLVEPLEKTVNSCTVLVRGWISGTWLDADASFSVSIP